MQPDTTKENGHSVLEKLDTKIKENNTPTAQWDYLAFSVIYNELAPNGFNRGTEYVKVNKKLISKTQKVAAQLIRGFREKAKQAIQATINLNKSAITMAEDDLKNVSWVNYYKRDIIRMTIARLKAQKEAYELAIKELDQTTIE